MICMYLADPEQKTIHWTLTGDSYLASFDGDLSSVNLNGYHLYVNGTEVTA